ncbi:MAG: hypothetical protein NT094_05135 [Candidatus Staskawiczbacteria bacterium]|nr:hypothetical protein [Candidatus Staskawiczbacteria bacterium]
MKQFIKENQLKISIILVLVLIGWFYWYQWRPSQIIKACEKEAIDLTSVDIRNLSDLNIQNGIISDTKTGDRQYNNYYNLRYQQCLKSKGLEK